MSESTAVPKENYYCFKCSHPDVQDNLVQCGGCVVTLHYNCAGIDGSDCDPSQVWKCNKCKLLEMAEAGSLVSAKSRGSGRSKTSEQLRQLSLQKLEEERKLMLKHLDEEEAARKKAEQAEKDAREKRMEIERRLMQEKYNLLSAEADDGASKKSGMSSRASQEKVQMWLSRGQGGSNSQAAPPRTGLVEAQKSANPLSVAQIDASAEATIVDPPVGLNIPRHNAQQCSMQQVGKVPPSSTSTPQSVQKEGKGNRKVAEPPAISRVPAEVSGVSLIPNPAPMFSMAHDRQTSTNLTYGLPTNTHLSTGFVPPTTTLVLIPGQGLTRPVSVYQVPVPSVVPISTIAGAFPSGVTSFQQQSNDILATDVPLHRYESGSTTVLESTNGILTTDVLLQR